MFQMGYLDKGRSLQAKSEKHILLVGSYPLEHAGGQYFAPRNYLDHWHRLAECCACIDFFAHIWQVESPQYDSYVNTECIRIFPLSFLSASPEKRSWRDFVRDQRRFIRHARASVGWIESFPAAGGLLSPIYYSAKPSRRIVYLKVDWREQILHRISSSGRFTLKDRIRLLYFEGAQRVAVQQADVVLVRGRNLYERYRSMAKHIELARPITGLSSQYAFQREDTCTNDLIRILYVGDLCKRKRPLDAVHAVADVVRHMPDKEIQLTFVGKEHEIPEERVSVSSIMQVAYELGIRENVRCVGHINDPAALSRYYQQADIFLLLSAAEGFPRVVTEALLHSLPVIVTPVGGIPDELVDGTHALFVPVDSPGEAAGTIARVISELGLRQNLLQAGYAWAVEQMREPAWQQHARLLGLL